MTTLEAAAQRLNAALDTLEERVAAGARPATTGGSPADASEAESLRRQLADLTAEYDSLLERYDALVEKNIGLSGRLDATIASLKGGGFMAAAEG